MKITTLLIMVLACYSLSACQSIKPPPQCQGKQRALNGIKFSQLDTSTACVSFTEATV